MIWYDMTWHHIILYVCVCACVCVCVCLFIYGSTHIYIYTRIYIYIYIFIYISCIMLDMWWHVHRLYVYMCVCMIHTYTPHTHITLYVYIYIYIDCVCIHIRLYKPIFKYVQYHVCVFTQINVKQLVPTGPRRAAFVSRSSWLNSDGPMGRSHLDNQSFASERVGTKPGKRLLRKSIEAQKLVPRCT